ncbi:CHAT domain-containing protein [bacterium]|nr:CHAT domain-containing protein [bacterium]
METQKYLDCELYLSNYKQAKLKVGQGRDEKTFEGEPTLGEQELQRKLLQASLDATQYGEMLFDALFPPGSDLLAGYREGLAIARHQERRLRLRLYVATGAPFELHDFNWELLYDSKKSLALGYSRDTVLSRFMTVDLEPGQPVTGLPRLLIVVSDPTNLDDYGLARIGREAIHETIERALKPLAGQMVCEFLKGPATRGNIRDRLVGGGFHILHIQAHGGLFRANSESPEQNSKIAGILLERENGEADVVSENDFSKIFEGERSLRLATLICCHSGKQTAGNPFGGLGPSLVKRGIPAVITMRQAISMEAAARFVEHFYVNLTRSGQVDVAANEARWQLALKKEHHQEWGMPALFLRLPDGKLWEAATKIANVQTRSSDSAVSWPALLKYIGPGKVPAKVVPFIGPDIIRGLLPSDVEVALRWSKEFDYPLGRNTDLPNVAQFMATYIGQRYPHISLREVLIEDLLNREGVKDRDRFLGNSLTQVIDKIAERHFDQDENEPHRILAALPFSTYITSNYDSFMTAALQWSGKKPQRKSCRWRIDFEEDLANHERYQEMKGTLQEPLVFHMFGHDDDLDSLVLTEDDHLDFLRAIAANSECIPRQIHADIANSMLLFLGYTLGKLDCRVLYRGIVAHLKPSAYGRIAVLQIDPDQNDAPRRKELIQFVEKYCRQAGLNIEVYWGTVRSFLTELHNQWKKEYGKD